MRKVFSLLRKNAGFAAFAAAFAAFFAPVLAMAQTTGTDPLAALVSGISFANLETDIVTVGIALASLYIVWVGIHWILRMIRHG